MKINKQPFFSICIPAFNAAFTLQDAINSVTQQNYDDYEILIADQGGNSIDTIDRNEKVFVFFLERPCSYSSRVFLYKKARGKYIISLDADDTLKPNSLEKLKKIIEKSNFLDVYFFNESNNKIFRSNDYMSITTNKLLNDIIFEPGIGTVWSKCFKNEPIHFIDSRIFQSDDVLLSLQIVSNFKYLYFINESFYNYDNKPTYYKHIEIHRVFDRFIFLYQSNKYLDVNDPRLFNLLIKNFTLLFYSIYSPRRYFFARKKIRNSVPFSFSKQLLKKCEELDFQKTQWRINVVKNQHFLFCLVWNVLKHIVERKTVKMWKSERDK